MLVPFQDTEEDYLHFARTRFNSERRSSNPASSTLRRGLMTIIQLSGKATSSCRTASRILRLIRLRTTALPKARGVVKPNRTGFCVSPPLRQNATKKRVVRRDPRL